jgi:hypothetical protein
LTNNRHVCFTNSEEANANQSKIDEEYLSLMAELGEAPPPTRTRHHAPEVQAHPPPEIAQSSSTEAPSAESSVVNTEKSLTWIQKQGNERQTN